MPQSADTGTCLLSIDLTAANGGLHWAPHASATSLETLHGRLAEARIPLTWGVQRSQAAVGRYLLAGSVASEVALLADGSWTAEGVTRRQVAQVLSDGLNEFRAAGLSPTTVLLPSGRISAHDDLLVKHGIQMLRIGSTAEWNRERGRQRPVSSVASAAPWRLLRWGLWEAAATVRLAANAGRVVERALGRLRHRGGTVILVAQSGLLCESERIASRVIGQLAGAREGGVRLETFASVVAKLRVSRLPSGVRSILHPAA